MFPSRKITGNISPLTLFLNQFSKKKRKFYFNIFQAIKDSGLIYFICSHHQLNLHQSKTFGKYTYFLKFCASLLDIVSNHFPSVLVSEKISQKCENASGFWIKVESRTYIYLDFYARCFYPGKFASFIFKYLRGISNWFQSGGEDWGLRMDTRISIQNIFIRNLNVRPHAAGTHTHTHHTWLILLQAGDIRAIYWKKYNDSPHLRRPEVYYVSFIKNYQLINSFISRQTPLCNSFIP